MSGRRSRQPQRALPQPSTYSHDENFMKSPAFLLASALFLVVQTNLQAAPDPPGQLPVELPSGGTEPVATPSNAPGAQSTSPSPAEKMRKRVPAEKTGSRERVTAKEKVGTAALEVTDQQLQDSKVVVSKVSMPKRGWLVIHGDVRGQPGPILGKVPLSAGESRDVSVALIVPPKSEKLWAMLHVDEGKLGLYDFVIDGPLEQGGSVVMMPFSTK
jgi:hypothetical protein